MRVRRAPRHALGREDLARVVVLRLELAVAHADEVRVDRARAGRAERDVKAKRFALPIAAREVHLLDDGDRLAVARDLHARDARKHRQRNERRDALHGSVCRL